ncbi:MAG: universal stress protein [Burkholderiaceae bacterium]|jgi:nucleotide-binding universal stress UspA family protein|nr:universal stress protein [Burkholderiaceae bacterium]
MKILLAVDGSPFSRKMLIYVASNEKWFRREFTYILLHVAPGAPGRGGASGDSRSEPILDEAAHFLRDQVSFDAVKMSLQGKPATVIPDFARRQECNLIVMGSHGYRGLTSLVLGSVTQGVLTSSHVPVLVVR